MTSFPAEYKGFGLRWSDWIVTDGFGRRGAIVGRWIAYRPGDDLMHYAVAAFDFADTPHPTDAMKAAKQSHAYQSILAKVDDLLGS
jgi:hypothetical protein